MKYQEAFKKIEKVMKLTGIREYCTNICKGDCCSKTCYESERPCYKNEDRRLACSIFLCSSIYRIFKEPTQILFDKADSNICKALRDVSPREEENNYEYRSLYFYPYTKDTIKKFEVNSENINKFVAAALEQSRSIKDELRNMSSGHRSQS